MSIWYLDGTCAAEDGYFTSFITSKAAPIVFMLLFLALTAWIVYGGVEKGIEKFSSFIMPGLIRADSWQLRSFL